jgi:hypothetical protein
MEEAASGASQMRFSVDICSGTRLARRVTADRLRLREPAQPVEALDQNANIGFGGEKAVLDVQRCAWIL